MCKKFVVYITCLSVGLCTLGPIVSIAQSQEKKSTASSKQSEATSLVLPSTGAGGSSSLGLPDSQSQKPSFMQEADTMKPTTLEWSEDLFDFGEIKQGDKVRHTFTFTNTGSNPLKITQVKPSCGCTTPNYSQDLVQPGEEGFVEVVFNSAGKSGSQMKSVTLFLNTESLRKTLKFKGFILPAKEETSN